MNSKQEKKSENSCRKKVILGDRKAPQPTPHKMVWVINMEGSTFIPVNKFSQFEGDPEVKTIMMEKTLPEINKNVGKIWIKQQQNTLKSQIFPTVHTLIKILLFFLCISLMIILVFSQFHSTQNSSILIIYLYCVLACSVTIIVFTFSKEYQTEEYDQKIIKQIKEILCQCNNMYLKSKGYIAKCDEWGIWISVGEMHIKRTMSDTFSNDSI